MIAVLRIRSSYPENNVRCGPYTNSPKIHGTVGLGPPFYEFTRGDNSTDFRQCRRFGANVEVEVDVREISMIY